jgi:hypothetical protein
VAEPPALVNPPWFCWTIGIGTIATTLTAGKNPPSTRNERDRDMRKLLIAAALAAMLVVGVVGYALGSIPSSDGFIHACYANSTSRVKPWVVLDADQAPGDCPAQYPNEVKLVGTAGP